MTPGFPLSVSPPVPVLVPLLPPLRPSPNISTRLQQPPPYFPPSFGPAPCSSCTNLPPYFSNPAIPGLANLREYSALSQPLSLVATAEFDELHHWKALRTEVRALGLPSCLAIHIPGHYHWRRIPSFRTAPAGF
jgi:hypothetical protein